MINLYFQICSLFGIMLVLVVYFSKEKVLNLETKIFTALSIIDLIGIILDIVIVYIGYISPNHIMVYILNKFYLTYILVWITLFAIYVVFISAVSEETKKFRNEFMKYSILLNSIAIILIFLLPVNLYNQDNVMYSYGPSVTSLYIAVVFYCIIIFISVLSNIKNIKNKKYLPLLVFIILIVIALVARSINPGVLLTTAIITYINMIMYFTIENPDLKMIEQLEVAKTTSEKANRAKSDFLSSMSHEIRTPLNAVMGFSECIKNANSLEEAKEDADDVISASETLLEIVNGILDISKIEAGKLELVESDYNVNKLFGDVQRLIEGRIGEKPLEFDVHIAEDIPNVLYGDHSNIKKIMINLLTNAVKYTDKGYVKLDVNCVKKDNICRLFISVKDSGRGIKPEQIKKLFTKFQRLEEDKNTTIEGTGLGLAITKQLVEMMNGNITVKSTYGEGSEFIAAIDQRMSLTMEDIQENEQNVKGKLDLSGKRILIVDDNQMNIKVTTKLLAKYKPEIDSASSGSECLAKIKSGKQYDLILMDDMMPSMSGVETLKELKKDKGYNIPTIALTANAIHGMREKYLEEGFTDYLAKPIEKDKLFQVLSNYVSFGSSFEIIGENKSVELENNYNNEENTEIKQPVEEIHYQDFGGKKVLIVDDNQMNIKIASKFLEPYNFEIDEALSGFECLNKVKENKYDLIFMDIMMPEMDGVETFHKLEEIKDFDSKVIVLTADAIEGARERYLAEGFDEYISKPINKKELDRILHNLIIENSNIAEKMYTNKNIPSELFDMDKQLNQIKIDEESSKSYKLNQQVSSVFATETKQNINELKRYDIDVDQALDLLGDEETYQETLSDFINNIDERIKKLDEYQKKEDMENYAIEVHALKSDAKYLGLKKLADFAFNHELKSKANNLEFIKEHYKELIDELNEKLEIIKDYTK